MFTDEIYGLNTILPLRHNVHVPEVLQQIGKFVPRELFVIYDHR